MQSFSLLFLGNRDQICSKSRKRCCTIVAFIMFKRPCNVENATHNWTAFADRNEKTREDSTALKVTSDAVPLLYSDDKNDSNNNVRSFGETKGNSNEGHQTPSEIVNRKPNDTKKIKDKEQDKAQSQANIDRTENKIDRRDMDLPGLTLSYEPHRDAYSQQRHLKFVSKTNHEDTGMHQKPVQNAVSKEFIDTYCRTLEELEHCRGEISKLRGENKFLVEKLKGCHCDLECHKNAMKAEKHFRERIQNDLRRIINEVESYEPETCPSSYQASSCDTVADIEYYKDQFRTYEEDFKQEKQEKLKLRELNALLTTELEEAKQTIESQQKKLLVYAQIFSNGTGAQVVLPPAYIGRRVRSNPSSPSYNQLQSFGRNAQQFYEAQDCYEVKPRKPAYEPIFDVVPKGSDIKCAAATRPVGRRISVALGEVVKESDTSSIRGRSNSIGTCRI